MVNVSYSIIENNTAVNGFGGGVGIDSLSYVLLTQRCDECGAARIAHQRPRVIEC
jgi:hypothetical protein